MRLVAVMEFKSNMLGWLFVCKRWQKHNMVTRRRRRRHTILINQCRYWQKCIILYGKRYRRVLGICIFCQGIDGPNRQVGGVFILDIIVGVVHNGHVGNFIGFARVHFWSSSCAARVCVCLCKLKPHDIPCVCKFNNREIRHYLAWDYRAIL